MTETVHKEILLVADDDPENVQLLYYTLQDQFTIRVASDGLKALELAKAEPSPDLVLLDVIMPHMDGYEVCRQLKADPKTRDIPVIFLTGKAEVTDETRGFEAGAVDYIHKPFSTPIVKARVQTHLMLRDARETVARQLTSINSELEMAREVQQSIIPQEVPKLRGLEIAARYLPMSTLAGDFYNFIVIDEKHIGILIADASGHGLPAALIASRLEIALATQSPRASDPAEVLSGLNGVLCGKVRNHFVTAAYLFLDVEKSAASYAGAAHPPLLHWSAEKEKVTEYLENGLMLGPFSHSTYSAMTFPLQKGDRIVLVTDGVIEALDSAGNPFGIDRLKQAVESKHNLPANRFADALLNSLSEASPHSIGSRQSDDITLLAIDFSGV